MEHMGHICPIFEWQNWFFLPPFWAKFGPGTHAVIFTAFCFPTSLGNSPPPRRVSSRCTTGRYLSQMACSRSGWPNVSVYPNELSSWDPRGQGFYDINPSHLWKPIYPYAICSMYGICSYIWVIFKANVGKYSIHGAYGLWMDISTCFNPWKKNPVVEEKNDPKRGGFVGPLPKEMKPTVPTVHVPMALNREEIIQQLPKEQSKNLWLRF